MTMNINEVKLETASKPSLTIGRVFTRGVDCVNYLLGEMEPDMLVQRTSAFAYFTELDGVFYAADTGNKLLRALVEDDELIRNQLQLPSPIKDWLYSFWSRNVDDYIASGYSGTVQEEIETPCANNIIPWQNACKYFEDNYNYGLIWTYLLDNFFEPGDCLDLLSEEDLQDMEDRVDAWESDRYLAITRITKHYFTVGMRMDSLKADVQSTATAFAVFMDNYDKLRDI